MVRRLLSAGVAVAAIGIAVAGGRAANLKDSEWRAYSGDKGSTKYSPLDQIDRNTIGSLRIAWRQSGMLAELRSLYPNAQASNNWEHTPLMVGGLMYMSTAVGTVAALDPATGKVVW